MKHTKIEGGLAVSVRYFNLYEMNGWETSWILTPVQWASHDPFLPITFPWDIETGD